jgi:uncharacterized RDD family membrane protein YckC
MQQPNPYAPPVAHDIAIDREQRTVGELEIASNGLRFLNLLIDFVGITIAGGVLGFGIGILQAVKVVDKSLLDGAGSSVFGLVVDFAYYVLLEWLTGRTLGKLLTGTKVVRTDGRPPRLGQVVGRTLVRLIPFEPFSFFGKLAGWHDGLSGTRVVRTRGKTTASTRIAA